MVPMHPQPKAGEIFSSWLVRLSLANGLPLHSFYSGLLNFRQAIWSRDIDRHPPIGLLECLNHVTKASISQLNELSLKKYEGLFYDSLSVNGVAPWLLPLGIYHRTHKLAGMQFCPLCLKNDSSPYYRLKWRIGLIVLCEVHNCVLMDHCPRCNSPIIFHRHGIGRGKYLHPHCLKYCYACNDNLAAVEPIYPQWPDLSSQFLLERLIREFDSCPWQGFPVGADCPLPFFIGLRAILNLLNGRYGERLQNSICSQLPIAVVQTSALHFEYLGPARRLHLLLCACWLIQNWPDRFVTSCRTAGLSRSRILEEPDASPYWLEAALSNYLDNRTYSPNQEKFLQAAAYLVSNGLQLSTQNVMRVLGVQRDAARRMIKIWLPYP